MTIINITDGLKHFGKAIDHLISGNDLTREHTRELFAAILTDQQPELHQGAFLAALSAKGPTPKEIAGAWEAIHALDTVKLHPITKRPLVENSGTGMDIFKTFNISTCSAIAAAAGGVPMARHGARAITSRCGTVDVCEELGVDVESPADIVRLSIEKSGIGLFNGMSPETHPRALFRILRQIRFGSVLNIAASLANPASPKYAVRGVFSKDFVKPTIEAMREIGLKRAIVFHGTTPRGGVDELSPLGENLLAELSPEGEIVVRCLDPSEVGIKSRGVPDEIAAGKDRRTEALRLLRIITGQDKGLGLVTVCLNAAPIFYISGMVSTLKQGYEMALALIESGSALQSLFNWVQAQNSTPEAGRKKLLGLLGDL
jgi:anthranilate phosphoribosyltransferase